MADENHNPLQNVPAPEDETSSMKFERVKERVRLVHEHMDKLMTEMSCSGRNFLDTLKHLRFVVGKGTSGFFPLIIAAKNDRVMKTCTICGWSTSGYDDGRSRSGADDGTSEKGMKFEEAESVLDWFVPKQYSTGVLEPKRKTDEEKNTTGKKDEKNPADNFPVPGFNKSMEEIKHIFSVINNIRARIDQEENMNKASLSDESEVKTEMACVKDEEES